MSHTGRGSERVRVMLYSHNGVGLGHLRRNINIATRFVSELPGSSVLLLTGCPLGDFFQLPPGVDFIKIPSIIKIDTGVWDPRTLPISSNMVRNLRESAIRQAAELFVPHLFLVDYAPTGVWGELVPTLAALKERDDPATLILGL